MSMKNLWLKIFSLLIAIALSIYVNSENNITTAKIIISVDVRDLPEDKIVLWRAKKQVEVEVRGPTFLVNRLVATPPTLKVKPPEESNTVFTATINRSDLDIQHPLQILSIEPSQVSFSVESKIKKEVLVKVPVIGQLKKDLILESTKIYPEKVSITGPESEISKIDSIQTIPVDLKDIHESFSEDLSIRMPGKLSDSAISTVKVSLIIGILDQKRTLTNIPIEVRQSGMREIKITPSTVAVTVSGTKSTISHIKTSEIIPFIKVPSNLSQSGKLVDVQVEVPDGYSALKVEPESVTVFGIKGR